MTMASVKSPNNTSELKSQATIGPSKMAVMEAFKAVQPGLALVEQRIKSRLGSEAELLQKIPTYLLNQGGKRIRPVLTLLTSRLFKMESPSEQVVDVAAGIELIHMATLLHDDIIDQSPTRRHQKSAYLEFGMTPSLLAGDFLLVRAFGLCAKLDQLIVEKTEQACVELTEGEILEGIIEAGDNRTFDDYINVIGKKTASLFELATTVGAHLSQDSKEVTRNLANFGKYAGIAFQMIDDILDITADEDLLGKPAGTDLKQKTPSLINILWLQSGDKKAQDFFANENPSIEDAKEIVSYLKNSKVVEEARNTAKNYANTACSYLDNIEQNSLDQASKEQLLSIVQYTLERCL